ncbi:hypothetical protein ACFVIM_24125 [Streptomyces sp. NPDC057638]|uniref:hypothetical protein n=1 Tax=Streptomyces sp. NPDC057638 TaxID=3346190 RepID=UPI0036CB7BD1
MRARRRAGGALIALVLALGGTGFEATAATGDGPGVRLSRTRVEPGGEITVSGSGWRPSTLLMILVCGENMIGGTNSCANAQGRAVTTGPRGSFSRGLPVPAPPRPCPCVVHVATVTGEPQTRDLPLTLTGHPTAPLPRPAGAGRLAVLATTRLEGDSGVLVFFGAPPSRRIVLTVGNLGTAPVRDPVFRVGTAHGLFAPRWEERPWRGTIKPGHKALVRLEVELPAGAHGAYEVSVRQGERLLVSQPWRLPRPWGVTVFWVLLAVVVPTGLFRIGMAVVDRIRPPATAGTPRTVGTAGTQAPPAGPPADAVPSLPWFAPGAGPAGLTAPAAAPASVPPPGSAPPDGPEPPTTKGHP